MEREVASLFKVLSDENRLVILKRLIEGETCGCTIIDNLSISQPTLSYHLNILNDVGLTRTKKEGNWKKHYVQMNVIDNLIEYLVNLRNLESKCKIND